MFKVIVQSVVIFCACVVSAATVATAHQFEPPTFLPDSTIRKGLEEHLSFDDVLRLRDISVQVTEGIALLNGTVASLFEKERAIALTETIRGVRAVIDHIKVEVSGRSDADISEDVVAALQADPATESKNIQTSVDSGQVKLSGTADSYVEKKLSGQVAKSVRGVRAVDNQIKVQYVEQRPDAELQAEIVRRLQSDVWVIDDLIRVKVHEGKVSLTGVVGSVSQRNVATVDAWVSGVSEVDASGLEVDSDAVSEARRQRKYIVPRWGQITNAVRDTLKHDPRINSQGITVHLDAGVIQLDGQVNTLAAKRAAEQDALRTRFVSRVDNRLVVIAATKERETKAESAVKAALARDIYVSDDKIEVAVNDGTVRLKGTINSKTGKQRAETIAESVVGITSVVNELQVISDIKPPTDSQIKYGVKNRLFWSSLVDDGNVTVIVDEGRVTLTGTVDDRAAFAEATRAAIEAGATDVENRLVIREMAGK